MSRIVQSSSEVRLETLRAPVERLDDYMAQWLERRCLPDNLREAIRYALLAPGKRLRPILVVRCCEAVGGKAEDAMAPAAAVEMVHAFSLVHDDLPAMDDDDLRRGRPALHRHSGEAMAILAGDALLGLAVELIVGSLEPPALAAQVCRELIEACNDMIAGQVYDTVPRFGDSVGPLQRLDTIHRHKTAALIRAACRMGALCGRAAAPRLADISRYGDAIGLMFQIVDDLLDVTQTTEHLGKTAGKDANQDKLTYPAVVGIEASRREIGRLRGEAQRPLVPFGDRAQPLRDLSEYLARRTR